MLTHNDDLAGRLHRRVLKYLVKYDVLLGTTDSIIATAFPAELFSSMFDPALSA